jgi:serine protease inhibitor ecotin
MESTEQPVHTMTARPETKKLKEILYLSGQGYFPILMKRLPFVIPGEDRVCGVP